MKPPPAMNTHDAKRARNAPVSDVWWPDNGSCNCAIDEPTLVSMICPAASKAHIMPANIRPITPPTKASLANSTVHCMPVHAATSAGGACSNSDNSAIDANNALRIVAGMISAVISGTSKKATATRVVLMPSNSASDDSESIPRPKPPKTPGSCNASIACLQRVTRSASAPPRRGQVREDVVGELVQPRTRASKP